MKKCGYVAVVGRPNVGKSTLINHILGQKLNITSRKPQTTRHNLLGIKTDGDTQAIYVDTPGMHQIQSKAINRIMNRSAESVIHDVDVIVFVVERLKWTHEDERVLDKLAKSNCPVILVINKVDQIDDKNQLLPFLEKLSEKRSFEEIIPLSALTGTSVEHLETLISERLPETDEYFFDENQITDKSERFLAAEIIREKLMRQLGNELPYATTVEIERYKEDGKVTGINGLIYVERDSQKNIVIGDKGKRLKMIGTDARIDIENLIGTKVMLSLWVKVKRGWSDDDSALKTLGFAER